MIEGLGWGAAAAVAASYLMGSIPTGYLLVRWVKRVDIRQVGSGNIGATNAARAAGKGAAAAVFLVDMLKGWIPAAVLAPAWWPGGGVAAASICGACAVAGHVFCVFLRFKGGKGVATAIGMLAGTSSQALALFLCAWVVGAGIFRYVSVGSILAAATIPVSLVIWHQPLGGMLAGTLVSALIVLRHRDNIRRLMEAKEPRLFEPKAPSQGKAS